MDNKYKFVDGDCKTIKEVISLSRVIPEKGQIVTVRYKAYKVFSVNETINFDDFSRRITIYLDNLK
jgi:hypothetical protein